MEALKELGALLLVRRKIAAAQRRESPRSWWARRIILLVVATLMVLGAFGLSAGYAASPDTDRERAGTLFLLAPITAAGYLLLLQLREGNAGHPLGDLRGRLPIARRRSAFLRVAEDALQPASLFVFAYGWSTWLGVALVSAGWLTPYGWLTVTLLPLPSILWKEAIVAFQGWLMESTTGTGAAVLRLGGILAVLLAPVWIGYLLQVVGFGPVDLFGLPLLGLANHPFGPVVALAACAPLAAIAAWIRCWPALHVRSRWLTRLEGPRGGKVVFPRGRARAMFVFEVVQAWRLPSYRYTAILLGVFGVMLIWLPTSSAIPLLVMTAFIGPMSGIFNLYGAGARYHALWLALGVTLEQWTRARLAFALSYMVLLSTTGIVIATLLGIVPVQSLGGMIALPVAAAGPGFLFGPAVSRFVLTPSATDVGRTMKTSRSARSFLPGVFAVAVGAPIGVPGTVLALDGKWWACWFVAVALIGVAWVLRPTRVEWTPRLRTRMDSAFRT